MSFLRNAGSLAATSVGVAIAGLVTSVVLARYLGPEQMGWYAILQRFATITFVLCLVGSQSASIYRLRRARVEPATVLGTSLGLVVATSLAATALLWANGEWIAAALLGGVPGMAYTVMLLSIPVQSVGQTLVGVSRGLDRFATSNVYLLGVAVGTGLALWIGFAVFGVELVGAVSIFAAVMAFATLWLLGRLLALTGPSLRTSFEQLRETVRYGAKSQAQAVFTHLHENVDVLILAALLDAPDRVAFYAIAAAIVNRIKILPAAIANALLPHVTGLETDRAAKVAARAARNSFSWLWGVALVVAVIAPWVVPWAWGGAFAESVRPMWLLLPATVCLSISALLARYFMAVNRQGVVVRTQACSTSLNVALNFALIPELGIEGAALASLVSYGTELCLITAAFRRSTALPLREVFVLDRGDLTEYGRRADALLARLGLR